jgi:hypothetical protein
MRELMDSIKTNTEMLTQLVQKPATPGREPFITYISDTLRTLPEDQYEVVKDQFNAALQNLLLGQGAAHHPAAHPTPAAPPAYGYQHQQQQQHQQHYRPKQGYQQHYQQHQQHYQPYHGQGGEQQMQPTSRDNSFTALLGSTDDLMLNTMPNLSLDSTVLALDRSLSTPPAPVVTGAGIVTITCIAPVTATATASSRSTTAPTPTPTVTASSRVVTAVIDQ